MATEWIDVVDTAVKIGLGALISGVASYSVMALQKKREIDKVMIGKKIEILEEACEHAETFFAYSTKLLLAVGGY